MQRFLRFEPWEAQARILESVRDNKVTSVASCHSAGKSAIAACAGLWFLYNHYPSVVITTAPTDRQVRLILWKEIRLRHRMARVPLGGVPTTQDLKLQENWFATGFTASDYDPDRFQGIHEANVLVIPDEACGITPEINEAIESLMASGNAKRLSIGNPTDPNTPFGLSFKQSSVSRIYIDAYETPNFTAFGITEEDVQSGAWIQKITGPLPYPMLISPEYAAGMAVRLGITHPIYRARVRGRFPEQSEDSLFTLVSIERARQAELEPGEPNELACDVARFGSDETVIAHRQGPVVRILERRTKEDTMQTAGRLVHWRKVTGATRVKVDSIGIGAGVVDRLREQDEPVVDVNFGAGATAKGAGGIEFLNLRAQAYWTLFERMEAGEVDLPDDDEVQDQLAGIRWQPTSNGKVKIEEKGTPSPDLADTLAIAFLQTRVKPEVRALTGIGDADKRSYWRTS